MATLTIPHSFTAGTPALASEVNANFQAIVNWTQSNIGTDNLGILTARSVALPSSPTLAILSLSQTASQPALSISNQGTDNPFTINQSGVFATGKGAIVINDPTAQTTSGAAHLLMSLSGSATIPAIKIDHGTTTMSLTKTQLDLFAGAVQATSAGVISGTTANLTTVNATTVAATDVNTTNVTATGLLDLTAPNSDAIVTEIKGRSSDNNAIVQFKSNDDATVYASATSSDSGLTLNLPDTADSYTFKVNGITKAVIDNNGIDAQYLTTTQQPFYFSWDASVNSGTIPIGTTRTLKSTTFTISKPGTYMVNIGAGPSISGISSGSSGSVINVNGYSLTVSACANMALRFVIQNTSGVYHDGFWTATQHTSFGVPAYQYRVVTFNPIFHPITLPEAGTYSLSAVVYNGDQDYYINLVNIGFKVWSL